MVYFLLCACNLSCVLITKNAPEQLQGPTGRGRQTQKEKKTGSLGQVLQSKAKGHVGFGDVGGYLQIPQKGE